MSNTTYPDEDNLTESTLLNEALLWLSSDGNAQIDTLIFETLTITMLPDAQFDVVLTIERPFYFFPSHKHILAAKSSEFYTIFRDNPSLNYYKLGQFLNREAILLWLKYIYHQEVLDLSVQDCLTLVQLLALSCRYSLPELGKFVFTFINKHLNYQNALEYYNHFRFITEKQINDYPLISRVHDDCLQVIDRYGIVALLQPALNDLDSNQLSNLIKRDTLRVVEWTLFATLMQWAQVKCRRNNQIMCICTVRNLLGINLQLIRFPLMRIGELYSIKLCGLVLQDDEYEDILSAIVDNNSSQLITSDNSANNANNNRNQSQSGSLIFSSQPRSDLGWFIRRFESSKLTTISSFPYEVHQIDLMVNQRIRLVAVGIFAPNFIHSTTCKSYVNLQIWNCNINERIIDVHRRVIHGFTTHPNIYRIVLTSCLYLLPKVRYSIVLIMRHANLQVNHALFPVCVVSGFKGKSSVKIKIDGQKSLLCKFKPVRRRLDAFSHIQNGSNHKRGQFPEIIFDTL